MLLVELSYKIVLNIWTLLLLLLTHLGEFSSRNFFNLEDLFGLCILAETIHKCCVREGSCSNELLVIGLFTNKEHRFINMWTSALTLAKIFIASKVRIVDLFLSFLVHFMNFWLWTLRWWGLSRKLLLFVFYKEVFLRVRSALSGASCLYEFLDLLPVFLEQLVAHEEPLMFVLWPSPSIHVAWGIRQFAWGALNVKKPYFVYSLRSHLNLPLAISWF